MTMSGTKDMRCPVIDAASRCAQAYAAIYVDDYVLSLRHTT